MNNEKEKVQAWKDEYKARVKALNELPNCDSIHPDYKVKCDFKHPDDSGGKNGFMHHAILANNESVWWNNKNTYSQHKCEL